MQITVYFTKQKSTEWFTFSNLLIKCFVLSTLRVTPPNSAFTLSLNYIQIKGLIIFSVPGCYGLDVILLH